MLVLTRQRGEALILEHEGVTITVYVTYARGSKAKLGIVAPQSVRVHRPKRPRQQVRQ